MGRSLSTRAGRDPALTRSLQLISLGLSLSICIGTAFGLGTHEVDIPDSNRPALARLEYVFSVLYNPALMATKTSILVFYLTLAKMMKAFKWSAVGLLVVVNVAGLALSLLNFFQCTPLSALFLQPHPADSQCVDIVTLYLSSAPLNIATDLCILLLPMPVLKSMRLPRKQKIILYITFGFGVFVTAVDVVRVSYLQGAALTRLNDVQAGRNPGSDSTRNQEEQLGDFAWTVSLSFMWSAIEVNVGIMCACVPALKPLVTKLMPNMLKDTSISTAGVQRASLRLANVGDDVAPDQAPSIRLDAGHPNAPANVQQMDALDFLTTPDMTDARRALPAPEAGRPSTANTDGTFRFFDFVNMGPTKSIVHLTNRESVRPVLEITVVFFLWGFAYGLLGALNSQFQIVAKMTAVQSIGIHSAYYAGYLVGPLTFGRLVLKHWGFKACIIIGLMIYGVGTLVFWPAAVLTSFPAFLVSNFIVGLGLSTLEISANAFIALCGPPEYGEIRLNVSQGVQAIGTLISPLIAKKALFNDLVGDSPSLLDVQWTYLAIALFVFIMAFVYYIIQVPEVSDDELEEAAEQSHPGHLSSLRQSKIIWITLGMAVFSQFAYVGAQEATSTSIANYVGEFAATGGRGLDYVDYEAIGHACFASSRFLSAGLGVWIKPRHQLVFWYGGLITFSVLAMHFDGVTSGAMLICVYFFEGPVFALIFAPALRGLGRWTREGSAALTAAISGGAVIPPIMHAVAVQRGSYHYAYCVIVAVYAVGIVHPIYLNAFAAPKRQVDPARKDGAPRRYSSAAMTGKLRRASYLSHLSHLSNRSRKKGDEADSEQTSTDSPRTEAGSRPAESMMI